LDLDRRFFSFFVLFELDRDLDFLEPLSSSSSLLDDSDDASFFVLFDLERDLDFLEPLSSSSLADDSDDELELNSEELLSPLFTSFLCILILSIFLGRR